eukprot:m.255309 g.255309  ORF g.255309 m.255309 type:complete len:302 (-) comp19614_c0_seq3:2393-3298(-)
MLCEPYIMVAPVTMDFDRPLDEIVKENSKAAAAAKKKISKKQAAAAVSKVSGKGTQKKPKIASKKVAGKEAIKQSRGKLQQLKRAANKNESISRAKNQREDKINARRGIAPSKKKSGKGKPQAVQTTKLQPGVRGKANKSTPKKNKIQIKPQQQQQPAKKMSQKKQKSAGTPKKQSKGPAASKTPRGGNGTQQMAPKRKPLRLKQAPVAKKVTPSKAHKTSGVKGGNPSPRAVTITIANDKAMAAKRQAAALALSANKQRRLRSGASKNAGGVVGGRRKVAGGQSGRRAGKKVYKVGGPRR